MLLSFVGTMLEDELDVIGLSDCAWRVTDERFAADSTGVLAYVERTEGGFTVAIMHPLPVIEAAVDSFATALAFVGRHSQSASGRMDAALRSEAAARPDAAPHLHTARPIDTMDRGGAG